MRPSVRQQGLEPCERLPQPPRAHQHRRVTPQPCEIIQTQRLGQLAYPYGARLATRTLRPAPQMSRRKFQAPQQAQPSQHLSPRPNGRPHTTQTQPPGDAQADSSHASHTPAHARTANTSPITTPPQQTAPPDAAPPPAAKSYNQKTDNNAADPQANNDPAPHATHPKQPHNHTNKPTYLPPQAHPRAFTRGFIGELDGTPRRTTRHSPGTRRNSRQCSNECPGFADVRVDTV